MHNRLRTTLFLSVLATTLTGFLSAQEPSTTPQERQQKIVRVPLVPGSSGAGQSTASRVLSAGSSVSIAIGSKSYDLASRGSFQGLVSEDVYRRGDLLLKAGTPVRGRVTGNSSNKKTSLVSLTDIQVQGRWTPVTTDEIPLEIKNGSSGRIKWISSLARAGTIEAESGGLLNCPQRHTIEENLDLADTALELGLGDYGSHDHRHLLFRLEEDLRIR